MNKTIRVASMMALGMFVVSGAFAQGFFTGFNSSEGYTGSAAGTILIGQNSWYQPVTGSTDLGVFTYTGNALGLVANPTGGNQFAGIECPGVALGRGAQPITYDLNSRHTIEFDFACKYNGVEGSATQNVASVSLEANATSRSFILLHTWNNPLTPTTYDIEMVAHDAAGTQIQTVDVIPNLQTNRWYREYLTWSYVTNKVEEIKVVDILTGVTIAAHPVDMYLRDGAIPTLPAPVGVRLFVGGAVAGNAVGYDNLGIGKPVEVSTVTTTEGFEANGSAADLAKSDDTYYSLFNDDVSLVAEAVFQGTAPSSTVNGFTFEIEASVLRFGLAYEYSVYKFSTNTYEPIAGGVASAVDATISRYRNNSSGVYSSGGALKAKAKWLPINDEDPSQDGWLHQIDVARWNVM